MVSKLIKPTFEISRQLSMAENAPLMIISKPEIKPAVAVIIFNEKGQVLLQRRKDNGLWCIISGHVEFGETISQAVLREVYEETNSRAEIVRFIGIYTSPASQTYFYPNRQIQYVTHFFEVALLEEIPSFFSNNETRELKFFDPAFLPEDMAPLDPSWLDDALNREQPFFIR